jgi:predicted amidohydrolase
MASTLNADLRASIAGLLDVAADDVWNAYTEVFGGLSREFGVTIVAPSAYLPDPFDGVIRNLACVFGTQGELLGNQAKVVLHPEDVDIAQAGSSWDVVPTELGRLGVILGSDVLYPEVGRLLAYQGAEALVALGASTDPLLYNKIRSGILARMQDNQLFAAASFLVGDNELSLVQRAPFVGKSALLAPQELTPRQNGVLVEMGNHRSEGVLSAEWDFVALRRLWESSDTPVRQQVPVEQAGQVLAQLYTRLQGLPRVAETAMLAETTANSDRTDTPDTDIRELDELAVVSSFTSRWPLGTAVTSEAETAVVTEDQGLELSADGEEQVGVAASKHVADPSMDTSRPHPLPDDETDEMDALPHTKDTPPPSQESHGGQSAA